MIGVYVVVPSVIVTVTFLPHSPVTCPERVQLVVHGVPTVKVTLVLLDAEAAVVTTTGFVPVMPAGTTTEICPALQELIVVAAVPLNVTVPWLDPKLFPLMRIESPIAPMVSLRPLMNGLTAKATPLLPMPFTVTETLPEVAALGTVTVMLVELQELAAAA